jgi:transcriptional regulator with GAF, ATPase, and Fis domain
MSPPPSDRTSERSERAAAPAADDREPSPAKKFPDFVAPTKIHYGGGGPTLHLRRCKLVYDDDGRQTERTFDQGQIRIGAMDDNDVVIRDDTVSRYHCRIVQEDTGYVLYDLSSTNGTFVNKVRIREAFLKPGCTVQLGQSEMKFYAGEEEVEIVPSRKDHCGDLVGKSAKMREIYSILEKIAPTNTTVVIEGETGTGKEVVAQTIHKLSLRANGPLMVFDCGAVPENLIESELFGHEKGSFTGAIMTRQGLFEMADGGTVFLDELGELPLDLQPKLLRALEQREIRRVGSNRPLKVDVRIIAATNRNLEDEVRAGRFRQDLFYRLSVVRLILPPLRERADDIPALVRHFLRNAQYNKSADGQPRVKTVSREAMEVLQAYRWPGNVRELVNAVERAVSFAEAEALEARDLPEHIRDAVMAGPGQVIAPARGATQGVRGGAGGGGGGGSGGGAPEASPRPAQDAFDATFKEAKERWVSSFEKDYIVALLRKNGGNISHAAREADIDRKYFRKLMKKYGIEAGDGDDEDDED